jgi:putative DNA primase/helicase
MTRKLLARPTTDLGNAERMADRTTGRLLYVRELGWLAWDGSRWERDTTGVEVREATAMVRSIYEEASIRSGEAARTEGEAEREKVGDEADRLTSWARQSESATKIRAAVDLARSREGLVARADLLDADTEALNVANGILNLADLTLGDHDPAAYHTKVTRASFDPDSRSQLWEDFLTTILPSEDVRRYVQKAVGYSLLGRFSDHLFIPWGSGKNGKSTFLWAVRHALGDYAMEAAPELLIEKRGSRSAGDMSAAAELRGRRFVTTIETGEGKQLHETFVKQLTGEHTMKAKFMRQDWFEFENQTAIWLATNHKPQVHGADKAIWERLHLIPFTTWVPPNERDPQLGPKLEQDRDAVLAWAVEGLRMYRDEGLEPPAEVAEATREYEAEMDPLREWMDECCEMGGDASAPVKYVRESYAQWCRRSSAQALGTQRFNSLLESRGLGRASVRVGGVKTKIWKGVRLLDQDALELAERYFPEGEEESAVG